MTELNQSAFLIEFGQLETRRNVKCIRVATVVMVLALNASFRRTLFRIVMDWKDEKGRTLLMKGQSGKRLYLSLSFSLGFAITGLDILAARRSD